MKMANTEKKGGFFARFRKNKTAGSPGESPQASPDTIKQSTSTASKPSPAKPAPVAGVSAQTRNDAPVDTAALVENLLKTTLNLGIEYLKTVNNIIRAFAENLGKTAEPPKGK